jgi:hypothetical protein
MVKPWSLTWFWDLAPSNQEHVPWTFFLSVYKVEQVRLGGWISPKKINSKLMFQLLSKSYPFRDPPIAHRTSTQPCVPHTMKTTSLAHPTPLSPAPLMLVRHHLGIPPYHHCRGTSLCICAWIPTPSITTAFRTLSWYAIATTHSPFCHTPWMHASHTHPCMHMYACSTMKNRKKYFA